MYIAVPAEGICKGMGIEEKKEEKDEREKRGLREEGKGEKREKERKENERKQAKSGRERAKKGRNKRRGEEGWKKGARFNGFGKGRGGALAKLTAELGREGGTATVKGTSVGEPRELPRSPRASLSSSWKSPFLLPPSLLTHRHQPPSHPSTSPPHPNTRALSSELGSHSLRGWEIGLGFPLR